MVDPLSHPGFAGKIRPGRPDEAGSTLGVAAQIPSRRFPYYADSMVEMAFVQPTLRPSSSDSSVSLRSVESSDSGQDAVSMASRSSLTAGEKETICSKTSLPLGVPLGTAAGPPSEEEKKSSTLPLRAKAPASSSRTEPSLSRTEVDTPRKKSAVPQDCAVLVVWLDRFEDYLSFPLESMTSLLHDSSLSGGSSRLQTRKTIPCLFIHRLPSGLYQISTRSSRHAVGKGLGLALSLHTCTCTCIHTYIQHVHMITACSGRRVKG